MQEKFLYVFPKQASNGSIAFKLGETRQPPAPGSPIPKVHLDKNSGKCLFTVTIEDVNNLGVEYTNDPLWAGEDCPCPPPQGINTDQIYDVQRLSDNQISFVDRNKGKDRTIVYQLNMIAGSQPCPFDPEIKNGGGTGNLYAYLLGGAALVALCYVAYEAFFNK